MRLLLSSPQIIKVILKLYKPFNDNNQAALLVSEFTTLLRISMDQFFISDYSDNTIMNDEKMNYNLLIAFNFISNERYNFTENLRLSEAILNIISNISNPQIYQGILTSVIDKSYQPRIIIGIINLLI